MRAKGINKNIPYNKEVIAILTVTYSVNGEPIKFEDLKNLQIARKDYIAYVENLKKHINKEKRKNKKG